MKRREGGVWVDVCTLSEVKERTEVKEFKDHCSPFRRSEELVATRQLYVPVAGK